MRKRFFRKRDFIFLIFVTIFLFLCLEGIARIYLFIRNQREESILDTLPMVLINENRIFDFKPNYYQKHRSQEFNIDIQINNDGLRDIEHSVFKSKGVYRILSLGDSMTFGWGVNQDETWWKILEKHLNNNPEAKYEYEIINLGVWMYTFDQQLLRLIDKGLKYKPDLVIQGISWPHLRTISNHNWELDDFGNIVKIYDSTIYVSEEGLLKTRDKNIFISSLKKHSKLLNFILNRLQVLFFKNKLITTDLVLLKEGANENYREAWLKTFQSIKQTKDMLNQLGIEYFIFLIPREVQISKEEWFPLYLNYMNEQMYQDDIPQKIFIEFFRKLEIPYIDLLPTFRNNYKSDLYFNIDPHWTNKGHEIAGEEIYNFLRKLW